jgi:metal-responsive CopG/Arc/MetJ family transcriptional regulator
MAKALYDEKRIKLVNVCLPGSMLAVLDQAASEAHKSRSAIIREAVEQYIKK